MKKNPQQLIAQFVVCPTSQKEYEIYGRKFIVISHFTGNKNINRAVYDLAESRADREMGLT